MSVRLEWCKSEYCRATVYRKGVELGDGNKVSEEFALVIGNQVVEGSAEDLKLLLTHAMDSVTRARKRHRRVNA